MRLSHTAAISISGLSWLLIGFFLLRKGLGLLVDGSGENVSNLFFIATSFAGSKDQASMLLVGIGLLLGYLKGRMVLTKSVKRVLERILSLPNPLPLTELYNVRYYVLISIMIGLGVLLKWVPDDIRGIVDVAIGCALLKGSLFYLRFALASRKQRSIENG